MKRYPSPSPLFSVRVKVPATSANLGPGFDVLGMALDYHNEVELTGWEDGLQPESTVLAEGEGASQIPLDRTNLVYRVARKVLDDLGNSSPVLQVKLLNRIPLARGMGSSSAAIVGAIVAANAACGGPLTVEDMLRLAVKEEGHPDNVVPALVGGLCVSVVKDGAVSHFSWKGPKLFKGLRAMVCVPSFQLSTEAARAALPDKVDLEDAVFNSARTALFLSALQSGRRDLLREAMEDRLHQPYRRKLVPGLEDVIAAGYKAGAYGACLSGAGPSVLALTAAGDAHKVGDAMCDAFRKHGVSAIGLGLDPSPRGARTLWVKRKKQTGLL